MAIELSRDRQMGPTDALMLRLERSASLRSTILQVAYLDGEPDPARLREKALHGTARIPRFRQVPVRSPIPGVAPTWVLSPDFDVDYHLRFSRLGPGPSLRTALDDAARVAMQAFDPARPLWESHVIGGLPEGRSVAIQKIHHSLGDGVSLLDMVMLFVDLEANPEAPVIVPDEPLPAYTSLLARTASGLTNDARAMARVASSAPSGLVNTARNPMASVVSALELLRSVARLTAPGSGPLSPIMQRRSLGARFDVMTVPLDEMKAAGRSVGGKLNAAFLAAVSGALRRYHAHHGSQIEAVRCAMPVSTRGSGGGEPSLGNQFSPTRFRLPINRDDAVERLEQARDLTAAQRSERALSLADPVARVLNTVPAPLVVPMFEYVLRGVDVVVSSVPGAPIPVYVAGARSLGNYGFSPRAGAALNITIISHMDELDIAVNSDPAAIPDPEIFMECLQDSFDEVCKQA